MPEFTALQFSAGREVVHLIVFLLGENKNPRVATQDFSLTLCDFLYRGMNINSYCLDYGPSVPILSAIQLFSAILL